MSKEEHNRKVRLATRPEIESSALIVAKETLNERVAERLKQKGKGVLLSIHEILGIVTEEYSELVTSVQTNNWDEVYNELLDIEVACNIARACIIQHAIHW